MTTHDTPAPFDPSQFAEHWETEGHGYSPNKPYIKSTDGHGNSELVNVKVPPTVKAIVAGIVGRNGWYRSVPDFFRDAVMHRIHFLSDNPDHPSLLPLDVVLADQETQWLMTRAQEERDALQRVDQLLSDQVRDRDWDAVAHTIARYESLANLTVRSAVELEETLEKYARELRRGRDRG